MGKKTLILAHNKTLAAQLYGEFKEFFPNNAVEYFVSYYDYYQPEAYVPRSDTFIEKDSSIITLDSRGNLGVRSVDDENKVVFHAIDIVDDSSDALILGGIPEGARVIVTGQNIVSDDQTVDPQPVEQDIIDALIEEVRGEVASQ